MTAVKKDSAARSEIHAQSSICSAERARLAHLSIPRWDYPHACDPGSLSERRARQPRLSGHEATRLRRTPLPTQLSLESRGSYFPRMRSMHPPFPKAKVGRIHVRPYPFSLSFDRAKARSTRWRLERVVALAAQRWAAEMKEASTYEGPLLATQFPTSYSLTMSSCSNSRGTVSITSLPISRDRYTVGTE
jgi:hypothetical protein